MPILTPILNRVVARPVEKVTKYGRFHLPDSHHHVSREAIVLAVGPGRPHPATGDLIPMQVKVGDRILLGWDRDEVDITGEKLVVIREDQIAGIIPSEKPNEVARQ